jgi:hypothetical protein
MRPVAGEQEPAPAGSADSFLIGGLISLTTYHFRISAADEVPNWSDPSDVASVTTLQGVDRTPPASVGDLEISVVEPSSVLLTWTAPGDDGTRGTAWAYDVRYWGTDVSSWEEAEQVEREPFPRLSGEADSIWVSGLEPNHEYSFALRTVDEVENWSGISTIVSTATAHVEDVHWWDGFAPHPQGEGIAGGVFALVAYEARLIAAGLFPSAGGVDARNIAAWNGEGWSPLGLGTNGPIHHLGVFDGDLIVSGDFTIAGGVTTDGIARWDGTAWSALGSGRGSGPVTVWDGNLVAAGSFEQEEGPPARMASWDGRQWTGMGTIPLDVIYDLMVFQDELYAAGLGTEPSGPEPVVFLVRWIGDRWEVLSRSRSVDSNSIGPDIRALLVDQGTLMAGGTFWGPVGSFIRFVARWDGTDWSRMDEGLACMDAFPREDCMVEALGRFQTEPIAVGVFYRVGARDAPGVAGWNGTSWSPFGSGMRGVRLREEDVRVASVLEFEGRLYVGGRFKGAGRKASWNIARWHP